MSNLVFSCVLIFFLCSYFFPALPWLLFFSCASRGPIVPKEEFRGSFPKLPAHGGVILGWASVPGPKRSQGKSLGFVPESAGTRRCDFRVGPGPSCQADSQGSFFLHMSLMGVFLGWALVLEVMAER